MKITDVEKMILEQIGGYYIMTWPEIVARAKDLGMSVSTFLSQTGAQVVDAADKTYQVSRAKMAELGASASSAADVASAKAAEVGTAVKGVAKAGQEKAGELAGAAHQAATTGSGRVIPGTDYELSQSELGGAIAAGAALAAGLLAAAYKLYQRKFSLAAKACSKPGMTYRQKSICILKFQIAANTDRINFLKSVLPKCNKTKNPEKCKDAINEKIAKAVVKIEKAKAEIANLQAKEKAAARESQIEVTQAISLLAEAKRAELKVSKK